MVAFWMVVVVCAYVFAGVVVVTGRRQPAEPPKTPSILDERLLEAVVVTLKSGSTFAGVLYAEDSGAVVLCKAENVRPDGTRVPADGEIVVLRGDIDFIQRP